ncbi:MAG: M48 family metalloprotease [Actinobacteria bacterium]|nr:M48 family metalloprotease [Actinomycetota bacterium]MBI3685993.1 M48 family metalloprotease [Actinomycetota bacterium]
MAVSTSFVPAGLVLALVLLAVGTGERHLLWQPLSVLGLVVVSRASRTPWLPGRAVRAVDEPELARLVRDVAERLGFRAPLLVRVVPVPDAALVPTRIAGTRAFALLLGWPLLRRLTAAQLAAVVAHELSHQRHLADRRESWLRAVRGSLVDSLDRPVRVPRGFAGWLLRLSQPCSWDAELAADAVAAEVAGTAAAREALVRTGSATAAFDQLGQRWIALLDEHGDYPEDLYAALDVALEDPYVARRIAEAIVEEERLDAYHAASHPPLGVRVAALPDRAGGSWDGARPVPLRAADALESWCVRELVGAELVGAELVGVDVAGADVPGADVPGVRSRPVRVQDLAPERLDLPPERARDALTGATGRRSLAEAMATAVDAIADGSWPRLARAIDPEIGTAPRRLRTAAGSLTMVNCVGSALSGSLLHAGWARASRWTASVLNDPDGRVVDLRVLVERAINGGDPAALRSLLAAAGFGAAP